MTGRDAVLNSFKWPEGATTTMVSEAYEGDHGFQMYDAVNGEKSVRIVEHIEVEDCHLVHSTVVVDGAAFMAFMGMGG
jgi:tRNA U38,U39,U40 pseudouridine synthase TruA